jgi:hypothetical protein
MIVGLCDSPSLLRKDHQRRWRNQSPAAACEMLLKACLIPTPSQHSGSAEGSFGRLQKMPESRPRALRFYRYPGRRLSGCRQPPRRRATLADYRRRLEVEVISKKLEVEVIVPEVESREDVIGAARTNTQTIRLSSGSVRPHRHTNLFTLRMCCAFDTPAIN